MNITDDVTTYLNKFDGEVRRRLDTVRATIKETTPEAVESLSYGLVGYKLNGKPLVYFGGFAHHVGFYATPNGHEVFTKEFAPYVQGKGSVQFQNDEPLPIDLIRKVVKFREERLRSGKD